MSEKKIVYNDGSAYEKMMGVWSHYWDTIYRMAQSQVVRVGLTLGVVLEPSLLKLLNMFPFKLLGIEPSEPKSNSPVNVHNASDFSGWRRNSSSM